MNPINNVGSNTPIQKLTAQPIQKQTAADPPAQIPTADRLELSGVSHLLTSLKTNDVRTEKVAQIRSQIENGTYETDDKLDAAADRLLDELSK